VLQVMTRDKAPIDGFGIGVSLDVSTDVPALDCAYKLQEYGGKPKRKLSEGKVTWPGRKQVWRSYDAQGVMRGDIVSLETDEQKGETLIEPVMRAGKRLAPTLTLAQMRERASRNLARLPQPLRQLQAGAEYPVKVAQALASLAKRMDAEVSS
jgi:nicotinate phosphoribosyltransferase